MQEIVDQLWRIRKKCRDYGTALEAKLPAKVLDDPRCACFAMIFNKCTVTLELLNFYNGAWAERHFVVKKENLEQTKALIEQTKKENGERCIEQTKMFFIGVLSAIEFCAKQSVKLYSASPIGQAISQVEARKRIYLNDIIQESNRQGLVSAAEKYKWERLIWLRNSIVHNNGVAESNEVYIIDAVTLTLINGKMIQGKLDTFTNFAESSVELYNEWTNNLMKQP